MIVVLSRLFIGAVFVVSALGKVIDYDVFLRDVSAYSLPLSCTFVKHAGILLVLLEMWLGSCFLTRIHLHYALPVARVLLLVFIPVTIWGQANQAPSCACYGTLVRREPWIATVEASLLLGTSFLVDGSSCNHPAAWQTILMYSTLIVFMLFLATV